MKEHKRSCQNRTRSCNQMWHHLADWHRHGNPVLSTSQGSDWDTLRDARVCPAAGSPPEKVSENRSPHQGSCAVFPREEAPEGKHPQALLQAGKGEVTGITLCGSEVPQGERCSSVLPARSHKCSPDVTRKDLASNTRSATRQDETSVGRR